MRELPNQEPQRANTLLERYHEVGGAPVEHRGTVARAQRKRCGFDKAYGAALLRMDPFVLHDIEIGGRQITAAQLEHILERYAIAWVEHEEERAT